MEVWPLDHSGRSPTQVAAMARLFSGREIDSTEALVRLDHDTVRREFMALWRQLSSARGPDLETVPGEVARWHERGVYITKEKEDWRGVLVHAAPLLGGLRPAADLHALRGRAHAEIGEWAKAVQDFEKALELGYDEFRTWYGLVTAHLAMGAINDYRQVCARLLERDGTPGTSTLLPNHLAWLFVLAPGTVEDWDPILRKAREAVSDEAVDWQHTLGTVLFRSGRLEEALAELTSVTRKRGDKTTVWEAAILAMVNARLGRRQEATGLLEKASRWFEANPGVETGYARTTLRLLLDEARQVVDAAPGP
jgi:tetratricopeptide (TPR) repeat protein